GATQASKLIVGGTAKLTGATVRVQALGNGTFAPSTKYPILTATGGGLGVANNNTFSGVATTNLAFPKPTLTYDAKDVFLTLCNSNISACSVEGTSGAAANSGFGFAAAAQTWNQRAVATSLDGGTASNPLVIAVLNQTVNGARQAFDALSGEVYGSLHSAQAEEAQFARGGMLGRMRQMSYTGGAGELGALAFGGPQLGYAAADANGGMPTKAPLREASHGLTFWAQGLGGWGHSDSDGNAASLTNRFGGFLSGADMRFGETWRAGLVAGYVRSDLNVGARSSSARIHSVQLGRYPA